MNQNITVSFTGHRPSKIGGYDTPNPIYNYICGELRKILSDLRPGAAISGMALGVDQWAAEICIELQIPFIAAVPFKGQELAWPKASQEKYHEIISHAKDIKIVSPGGYAGWKMQKRNVWMCDNSNIVIAVFDGTNGGTKNCFDYAVSKEKQIIRINPNNFI